VPLVGLRVLHLHGLLCHDPAPEAVPPAAPDADRRARARPAVREPAPVQRVATEPAPADVEIWRDGLVRVRVCYQRQRRGSAGMSERT
jgi:hypothetical protein